MHGLATAIGRPPEGRSAYFKVGGVQFLVWEMDRGGDCFQVFATIYTIPLGILKLSQKPSGTITIAGYDIDLDTLATAIATYFRAPQKTEPGAPRKKMLAFGFAENLGHHFWNEIGGLSTAAETGILDGIDGVFVGPYDYFNFGPVLQGKESRALKSPAKGRWSRTII